MSNVLKQGLTTFSLCLVFSLSLREPFLRAYKRISTTRMARPQKAVLGSLQKALEVWMEYLINGNHLTLSLAHY